MSSDNRVRHRRLIAWSIYLLVAASGLCQGLRPDSNAFYFWFPLAVASAMTFWCVLDSRIRGRPILTSLYLLIFAAWPLAVPIYLVWSRKLRGGVLAVVHGAALFVLWLALLNLPQHAGYWCATRGYQALADGDYDRAATLLNFAVFLRNTDAASWQNLGMTFAGQGRISGAADAFERSLELDRTSADCRGWLIWCKAQQAADARSEGDQQRAAILYREAIAMDRTRPELWHGLSLTCEAMGDLTAAIEAMQNACSRDAENVEYRQRLESLRGKIADQDRLTR